MEAPRVNASMLPQYSGRLVCLVGNVTEHLCRQRSSSVFDAEGDFHFEVSADVISSNGAELKIMTSDQKIVKVSLGEPLDEQLHGAVEVIGKVERDCSLSSQRIIPYDQEFDLNLYGEALSLASNYPDIFGSTHSNGFGY